MPYIKKILTLLFCFNIISSAIAQSYVYQYKIKTYGNTNEFLSPSGIAMDPSGNIYVADPSNNCFVKLTPAGAYITQFDFSYGTGNGQFKGTSGIAIDASGNIYVADVGNNRIQKLSSTGAYITQWGTYGSGNGQFQFPQQITVDASGNVYVTEQGDRVQKFSSTGTYITKWGSYGTGNGQFQNPTGIVVDAQGNVYVTDGFNKNIQKFSSSGTYITQWGTNLFHPSGITIDAQGNFFVTDASAETIVKFSSAGTYIKQWGNINLAAPKEIVIGPTGTIYVLDLVNSRVQVFGPSPKINDVDLCLGTQKQDNLNPNFTYVWTPTTGIVNSDYTNPIFDGTVSRTYYVNITNSSGYFAKDTVNVTVQNCPCPDTTLKNNSQICTGVTYDLNTLKTNTTAPGKWSIQGSGANYPTLTGNIFTTTKNTVAGNYTVRYTLNPVPSTLCAAYNERVITVVADPVIIFTSIPDQCINNPLVDLIPYANVNPAISGAWSGTDVTANKFNPSSAGTFNLSYSVGGICPVQKTTTVNVKTKPNPIISGDSTLCANLAGVQLVVDSLGGTWIGTGINASGYFSSLGLPVGTYPVQYQMNNVLCKDTAEYSVRIKDVPNVNVCSLDTSVCYGDKIRLRDTSQTKGLAYKWSAYNGNGKPGIVDQTSGSTSFYTINSDIDPGIYDIFMEVTFTNGCINTTERKNALIVNSYPKADFSFSPNLVSTSDSIITFTNTSALPYDSLFWQFTSKEKTDSVWGNISNVHNPLAISLNTADNQIIPVCLTVYNKGCEHTFCDDIIVKSNPRIFVPNAFTPNGDGLNDVFLPEGTYFDNDKYSLMIFDRWGEMIFQSNNSTLGWNGKRNNDMEYAQADVYVWKIIYADNFTGRVRYPLIGNVTLLR